MSHFKFFILFLFALRMGNQKQKTIEPEEECVEINDVSITSPTGISISETPTQRYVTRAL